MSGAVPPLPQYAFMAWCSVKKAQGQLYLYLYIYLYHIIIKLDHSLDHFKLSFHPVQESLKRASEWSSPCWVQFWNLFWKSGVFHSVDVLKSILQINVIDLNWMYISSLVLIP
jgi:hypothetical protein